MIADDMAYRQAALLIDLQNLRNFIFMNSVANIAQSDTEIDFFIFINIGQLLQFANTAAVVTAADIIPVGILGISARFLYYNTVTESGGKVRVPPLST